MMTINSVMNAAAKVEAAAAVDVDSLRYSADKLRVTIVGAQCCGVKALALRDVVLKQLQKAQKRAQTNGWVNPRTTPIEFEWASRTSHKKADGVAVDNGGVYAFQPIMMGTKGFKLEGGGYTWYRPKCRFSDPEWKRLFSRDVDAISSKFNGWLYTAYYALALLDVGYLVAGNTLLAEALKGSSGRLLSAQGRLSVSRIVADAYDKLGV